MQVIHRSFDTEKPKAITKKQAYHAAMVQALRRRKYQDFLTAGSDIKVREIEEKAKSVNPDFKARFTD